ncbi:MAG TPA: endonuclease MutS2 [Myxococcota bacterium]|nr:endonuclease MutS2 [Myxococcota bacterium]
MSDQILARLEWPQLIERLAAHTHTPRGRARCSAPQEGAVPRTLFAQSLEEVLALLHETSEARLLLEQAQTPPLGGLSDLEPTLRRLGKGGVLGARELLELRATLSALHATERFLSRRAAEAPQLATHAAAIPDLRGLEDEIDLCIDAEGEVRDSASPALEDSRREARGLAADLQRRLAGYLRDPEMLASLSDSFVTMRNGRFVLPVRSDARTRVRGIVHDASGSGTTLFIEPEAVVELNNRMRQAELAIERETLRILRTLSDQATRVLLPLEAGLVALEAVDLAFARGRLSQEMDAVEPLVRRQGVFVLPQLRHPLLPPERVVPNDLRLGESHTVLVLSGPNAGGKTVALKCLALAALCVRTGLHVPAAQGCRMDLVDALLADIGDAQNLQESLSTFSAHVANLARIVEEATPNSLVVLDEIGAGTDPSEGASLAQAILEALADAGARVVVTTHFNLLKEMAAADPRFANACVEFDAETLAPTYRLRWGVAGVSSATTVAARMGLRSDVLERANALLERDDRRLDRMLSELASNRAALEQERSEALRLRAESEAARAEYQAKLAKLEARREELFRRMRADLDQTLRGAHAEVAAVIRDLQRGGGAREAAHARDRLKALETRADEAAAAAEAASPQREPPAPAVDWHLAKPGDVVRVREGGNAVLLALPDRRGRVSVQVGGARLLVPMDRLAAADRATAPPPARPRKGQARVALEREAADGELADAPAGEACDLRGLRVEQALDRLVLSLDRAAVAGQRALVVLHGLGSGALRDAVRGHLAHSPYVVSFARGDPTQGGDGVTIVQLEDSAAQDR